LAAEEDNKNILPKLWEVFDCNFSGRKLKADTPNGQKIGWYKLLRRLTGIGSLTNYADPLLGRMPAMLNYLNLYNQDRASGKRKIKPIKDRNDTDFIKLEELQDYLKKIKEAFKVNLALPKRLFPSQAQSITSTENVVSENTFRKKGDVWIISYRGENLPLLRDSKGLRYIAELLRNPGKEIHVSQLVESMPIPETEFGMITEEQLEEKHMRKTFGGDLGKFEDNKAKRKFKQRLEEIEREKSKQKKI
jgi:hypothetical protein